MKPQILIAILLGVALFGIGAFISYFFSLGITPFSLGAGGIIDMVVLTLVVLVSSLFLFGYAGVFVLSLIGTTYGTSLMENPLIAMVSAIPLLLALVAGNFTGIFLRDDLDEKSNVRDQRFWISALIVIALVSAVLVAIAIPMLPQVTVNVSELLSGFQQAPQPSGSGLPFG